MAALATVLVVLTAGLGAALLAAIRAGAGPDRTFRWFL